MRKIMITAVVLVVLAGGAQAKNVIEQVSGGQNVSKASVPNLEFTIESGKSGSGQDLLISSNKAAREKITAVLNFQRKNAGLAETSVDALFSLELILNGAIVKTYPLFRTLGDLQQYMSTTKQMSELSNAGLGWTMTWTFRKLGSPATPLTEIF